MKCVLQPSTKTSADLICMSLVYNQVTESIDFGPEVEFDDQPAEATEQDIQPEATELTEHLDPSAVTEATDKLEDELEQSTGPLKKLRVSCPVNLNSHPVVGGFVMVMWENKKYDFSLFFFAIRSDRVCAATPVWRWSVSSTHTLRNPQCITGTDVI